MNKPHGWCNSHNFLISKEKFDFKCRKARQGKLCKQFDYKIPEWSKKLKRGGVKE